MVAGTAGPARGRAAVVAASPPHAATDEVTATNVAGLAESAVERAQATADCEVSLEVEDAVPAWARPVALSRALACVLDNAVRAAGPGGHVDVSVHTGSDGVHLTVSDDGPGLGRVTSRTSLGLTTTRAMVAACNGSFQLLAGDHGGAVAEIRLAQAGLRAVAS
jgi:signal transduction histidine kinase